MNGTHAELFTFCLYENSLVTLEENGSLKPLTLLPYCTVVGTDYVPGIILKFFYNNDWLRFDIEYQSGEFIVYMQYLTVVQNPLVKVSYIDDLGYAQSGSTYRKTSSPQLILNSVLELANKLASTPKPVQSNA